MLNDKQYFFSTVRFIYVSLCFWNVNCLIKCEALHFSTNCSYLKALTKSNKNESGKTREKSMKYTCAVVSNRQYEESMIFLYSFRIWFPSFLSISWKNLAKHCFCFLSVGIDWKIRHEIDLQCCYKNATKMTYRNRSSFMQLTHT